MLGSNLTIQRLRKTFRADVQLLIDQLIYDRIHH